MKVLLYSGLKKLVDKSGIGKAIDHQRQALEENGIEYTTKSTDSFDVVHLNTVFPDSIVTSYIAKKKNKKIIYYAHSTMEDFKNSFVGSNLVAPLFKKWITYCYNRGDVIITPTEYSKHLLESYNVITKPIYSLSNGIDTSFYKGSKKIRKRFRTKYGIKDDDKVIISVGHYIQRKGIIEFVELAKKMPEYKFYWFGYTNPQIVPQDVKDAVSVKLPNLFFPGYVNKEELRDAYCGSDLFLFLSHEETEGIVILEALAAKIPVLVRDIPVYDNWLYDGLNVYKANDESEFVEKIYGILEKTLPNLTTTGYNLACERDLKNIGTKLKKIYANAGY